MSYPTYLSPVERAVRDEREAQDAKWGEQNHADGTGRATADQQAADMLRQICQAAAATGLLTWRHVLAEEVGEAFAEDDPTRLRAELIQVAAVAQAWAEAIDRRNTARKETTDA